MDRREQLLGELDRLFKAAKQKEAEAAEARRAYYDKVAEIFRLRDHEKTTP